MKEINELTGQVIGLAMKVHTALGPGLFESAYEACLCYELSTHSLKFRRQVEVPIVYRNVHLQSSFSADLVVENNVLLELKAVPRLEPIHSSQLLTYLRFANLPVGLLINFNVAHLKQGIIRKINRPTS
jgi:GxxExxY protein